MNINRFLGMLAPGTPIEQLPILPLFHDGIVERLRLVRTGQDGRLVLRLWSTDVLIYGNDIPLFVVTIEEQQGRKLAGSITMAKDTGNSNFVTPAGANTRWHVHRKAGSSSGS